MYGKHFTQQLSAYAHGELDAREASHVAEHLIACTRCRREFEEIKLGIKLAEQLPLAKVPDNLWNEIQTALDEGPAQVVLKPSRSRFAFNFMRPRFVAVSILALFALMLSATLYYRHYTRNGWEVARLSGTPRVGSQEIVGGGRLAIGQWLETDANSRARVEVGQIGHVEIDPNTRVQLVATRPTEHRLALAQGRLRATIYAPPRLFFVETPSAVAADLGCAYTLEVDEHGASLLHVTSGFVALDAGGRESVVPAGAACTTRSGTGPGTPYFEDASDEFRTSLNALDFGNVSGEEREKALGTLLDYARGRDGLTLWHLLPRVSGDERSRVYERLAALVPPPPNVTREGIMQLDKEMLDHWKGKLEEAWFSNDPVWKKAWRDLWTNFGSRAERKLEKLSR